MLSVWEDDFRYSHNFPKIICTNMRRNWLGRDSSSTHWYLFPSCQPLPYLHIASFSSFSFCIWVFFLSIDWGFVWNLLEVKSKEYGREILTVYFDYWNFFFHCRRINAQSGVNWCVLLISKHHGGGVKISNIPADARKILNSRWRSLKDFSNIMSYGCFFFLACFNFISLLFN